MLRSSQFGGNLEPKQMFKDDIWWNCGDSEDTFDTIIIPVQPNNTNSPIPPPPTNPMVTKAEEIFRNALKK